MDLVTFAMAKAYSDSKGGYIDQGSGMTKFYVEIHKGTLDGALIASVGVGFYT